MFLTSIWERYFLKEFCKVFFLFILCFYGLYVLIDYSNHSTSFHHHHTEFQWKEFFLYYFGEFVKRAEVLIPFALLITTIRTLCSLNVHNELVALMSSGISLRTLMRPFIFLGLFFTLLLYLNTQFFLPDALKSLRHIHDAHSRVKRGTGQDAVQHLVLEDQTRVIFQSYDSADESLFDAYWLRSIDDLYRIKHLYPNSNAGGTPYGQLVEHLVRNKEGELVETESFDKKAFPEMHFNKKALFETITPVEEDSLTGLIEDFPQNKEDLTEKEASILSALYYKLAMPWLCLFAIIGPAPFCLRFTRQLPIFFIYACSIFALVAYYLVMESAMLLGERQVFAPIWAIGVPFGFVFFVCMWKFLKLR